MRKKIVYISGPMSGIPNYNKESFSKAMDYIKDMGFDCINPVDICSELSFLPTDTEDIKWKECMKLDIKALLGCSDIFLLPGWNQSRGAKLEYTLAVAMGLGVMSYDSEEWRS